MATDTIQIVTTALAVLGAVLGLYNAWRNWVQDRVRLRVSVSLGQFTGNGDYFLMVNSVNLSTFPITITHIGFDHAGGDGRHAQIAAPHFIDEAHRIPVRLEPRTSATAAIPLETLSPEQVVRWRCAYVNTACGIKRCSSWREFARLQLALAPQRGPGAGNSVE